MNDLIFNFEVIESKKDIDIGILIYDSTYINFLKLQNEKYYKIDSQTKLTDLIKKTVKTLCSPRHVPSQIYFVTDLPRTFNGKLAEVALTDLVHERPIRNLSSLANPQALGEIAKILGIKEQVN